MSASQKVALVFFLADCGGDSSAVCGPGIRDSNSAVDKNTSNVANDTANSSDNCTATCSKCDNCLLNLTECNSIQDQCATSGDNCAALLCCLAQCPNDPTCYASDCEDPTCGVPFSNCAADSVCTTYFCNYGQCLIDTCGFPLCSDQDSPSGSICEECVNCYEG